MIGKPHHHALTHHPGNRRLNRLTGVLVDNRKDLRDVFAQGLGFRPPGECGRHRVQKRHPALAVSHQDGIPNTGEGDVQPFALLVHGGLHPPAFCRHGR
jgi:hypothetical protein